MITATQTDIFQGKAEYDLGCVWLLRDRLTCAQMLQQSAAKTDCFATTLPKTLCFDDDRPFRQAATALFLQAQAMQGSRRVTMAKALLRSVLRGEPNHALAADLPRERGT